MSYECIIVPMCGSWRRQFPLCRLRFTDNMPLAPRRGAWRISPQARRTLNVSVCPMLRRALSLSKFRGLSARKGTPCRCAFAEWQQKAGGQPARTFGSLLSRPLSNLKGHYRNNQLGFQSAPQHHVKPRVGAARGLTWCVLTMC